MIQNRFCRCTYYCPYVDGAKEFQTVITLLDNYTQLKNLRQKKILGN